MDCGGGGCGKENAEEAEVAEVSQRKGRGGDERYVRDVFAMYAERLRVELRWGHDDFDGCRYDGDDFH